MQRFDSFLSHLLLKDLRTPENSLFSGHALKQLLSNWTVTTEITTQINQPQNLQKFRIFGWLW